MNTGNLQLTSEGLRVLLETGFVLREASRFEDAEAVFIGCAELMTDSEVPLVGLATVYLQKGDFQRAIDTCREVLGKEDSSAYARLHLGEALLFNNQLAEARKELERVAAADSNSTYAETALRILRVAGIGE